ncbi:MAG: TetR/AcrR family transcriptional regulator [Archangium sp.]
MRYSAEHTETIRAKIVENASRAFRKTGIEGVSIPALMKKVGLTHGGFYSHFDDRDDLVSEAIKHASLETGSSVFAETAELGAALDRYLSPEHVAHPDHGCVIAALGADAPRQKASVRKAFAAAGLGLVRLVQRKLGAKLSMEPTDEALALTSQMIGAVILARVVDDPKLAARILRVAKRA